MKKFISFTLLITCGLVSPLAHAADEHPIDIKTAACVEKDPSTVGMITCAEKAGKWWDSELNNIYQALLAKFGKKAAPQLKTAQQQWLKFRDAEFNVIDAMYLFLYDKMGGGTIWSLMAAQTEVDVVKARVVTLTEYLNSLEQESSATSDAADEHPIDVKMAACIEKDSSTLGMRTCIEKAGKSWDSELNKIYQASLAKLGKKAAPQLKTAQQQWLKFRDAEFDAIDAMYLFIYEEMGGGTMWSLIPVQNKVDVVKARVLTLTEYLNSLEQESSETSE